MEEPTAADFAAAAAFTHADVAALERELGEQATSLAHDASTLDDVKTLAADLASWRRDRAPQTTKRQPTLRDVLQRALPSDALTGLDEDALGSALGTVRRLDVTGMGLSACDGLDCFEEVTHFYAGMNALPNFDGVALWRNLRVLVAYDNTVTSLAHLRDLPQLQLLDLRRNHLRGTAWVDDLPVSLQQLSVAGNAEIDLLDEEGRKHLLACIMSRCPALTAFDVCQPPTPEDGNDAGDDLDAMVDDVDFLEEFGQKSSRLCLPVAGDVTSTIRSTTDDLIRRMGALQTQSIDGKDVSAVDERSAALGNIRSEIIFALQHQRRVAASTLQDGWESGMRALSCSDARPTVTASSAYTNALAELRRK